MRIAPIPEFLIQTEIFISNIKTSDIADFTINDSNLPVITIIQMKMREEHPNLSTCLLKRVVKRFGNPSRAHMIIEDTNIEAFSRLFSQSSNQFRPETIIMDNIILNMDVIRRLSDIGQ